jgi:DNA-binding transcriptional regulator LsrR (DeoR family)
LGAQASDTLSRDDELALMGRASWLYFAGGMTHGEVGARLRVPAFKVQRLIAQATRDGLIRVFIDAPVAKCVSLEHELCSIHGLRECVVAPDLGEAGLPLKSLAPAGANFLLRVIREGAHRIIGLGHSRTLGAIVDYLPRLSAPELSFVALEGSLTSSFSTDPYDVIHGISQRTGATGYFMPAPLFANSAADRDVLLAQIGVTHVMERARNATLWIVGIGTTTDQGFLAKNGSLDREDLVQLNRLGARGEILTYFHDENGRLIDTDLSRRCVTLSYGELVGRNIVAAAGGPDKVEALRSILKTGLLSGLITDEATAIKLASGEARHASVMKLRSNRKRTDRVRVDAAERGAREKESAALETSASVGAKRARSRPAGTSKDGE